MHHWPHRCVRSWRDRCCPLPPITQRDCLRPRRVGACPWPAVLGGDDSMGCRWASASQAVSLNRQWHGAVFAQGVYSGVYSGAAVSGRQWSSCRRGNRRGIAADTEEQYGGLGRRCIVGSGWMAAGPGGGQQRPTGTTLQGTLTSGWLPQVAMNLACSRKAPCARRTWCAQRSA